MGYIRQGCLSAGWAVKKQKAMENSMQRQSWRVSTPYNRASYLAAEQLPMVLLGVELMLFKAMDSEPERKWTVAALANLVGADDTLLYRVLRYLFTLGVVRENLDSTYSANDLTRWLATDAAETDVKQNKAANAAMSQALPDILRIQQGQMSAGTTTTTPPQPPQSSRPVSPPDGEAVSSFMAMIRSRRQHPRSWMSVFPMQLLRPSGRDFGSGRITFVHVGAWTGQQCLALRRRVPGILSGMVLQVSEAVSGRIDQSELQDHGIELQVQDPTAVQEVVAAKAYYLKNALHDFPDEKCIAVLQRLRQACAADSMILIDETVLQPRSPGKLQAQPGLKMLSYLALTERSQTQWVDIITRAGLELRRVYTYDLETGDSVILAVPK